MSNQPPEEQLARAARALTVVAAGGARDATRLLAGGARLWWRQVQTTERVALEVLQQRLALATPPPPSTAAPAIAERSASDALADLLGRAVEQSSGAGREELFRSLVAELVPDEARILALLGGGRAAALVHVDSRVPGAAQRRVLDNATLIGARASLSVPDMARAYVTKLRALGLLEVGPDLPELATDYEILLAQSAVRAAITEAGINRVPGRAVKRSLRLSPLGEELWTACRP